MVVAIRADLAQGHRRSASTLHDCLDVPPPRERRSPWLLLIIVLVLLYYVYYCRIGNNYLALSKLEKADEMVRSEDTTVVVKKERTVPTPKTPSTELPCGANGCDIQAISKPPPKVLRGRLEWNNTETKVKMTRDHYPTVRLGGHHIPSDCQSRHKVAIIVPYRDNEKTLNVFLFNIHPFLMRQKIEYRIFVIEQTGPDGLNKGSLLNAGYLQALRFGSWHCLIFHDVDLLPMDERILYTCPTYPRHMSTYVQGQANQYVSRSKYKLFGGVVAMTDRHFLQVNGYSNTFWGCRGADSDIYWSPSSSEQRDSAAATTRALRAAALLARLPDETDTGTQLPAFSSSLQLSNVGIRLMGFRVVRYNKKIAVYIKLPYQPKRRSDADFDNNGHELAYPASRQRQQQFRMDGISTIRYKVMDIQQRILYTHVVVDLGPTPNYTTARIL
ncbi:hypothetical protein MSG28_013081 [Choristoneura fumiferana]|uniref:Uncharacterized protein n=1 Tax=Choristoneura fumiferana TaxID=7141 RepID=A0ACC0KSF8_CHOFU|nr:hypothetical protein MSG28_013081 [Choristoneura fumiferana]